MLVLERIPPTVLPSRPDSSPPPLLAPVPKPFSPQATSSKAKLASPSSPASPASGPSRTPSRPPSATLKRFVCDYEGCEKAYTKPARLAEHKLSHTGERPHQCPHCSQTYLRATHLHAHLRTHLSEDEKPFSCSREGCDKRFWTSSHLKRHEELHDNAEAYQCEICPESFSKAHLLRTHSLIHLPPGSKPFPCTHAECDASFAMKHQLKAHLKTHDPTRYTCSHPSHGTDLPSFPVWSALQTHIHQAHPPACPYDQCNGRTFKNSQRLKDHLRVHREQEEDLERLGESGHLDGTGEGDGEGDEEWLPVPGNRNEALKRKRRRSTVSTSTDGGGKLRRVTSGQAGKEFGCHYEGCGKKFKTKYSLTSHYRATHLGHKYSCTIEGCDKAFAHKITLTRHLAAHGTESNPQSPLPDNEAGDGSEGGNENEDDPVGSNAIGEVSRLTGAAFGRNGKQSRRYGCPFTLALTFEHQLQSYGGEAQTQTQQETAIPEVKQEPVDPDLGNIHQIDPTLRPPPPLPPSSSAFAVKQEEGSTCLARFWRVYDVRRHLAAEHGLELGDTEVRELLRRAGTEQNEANEQ